MATLKLKSKAKLPRTYKAIINILQPRAIQDDKELQTAIDMIDTLMSNNKLTKGQEVYLETLVQLVEAYESVHYAIDSSDIHGVELLTVLLDENDMNASDLARLLGVHVSMGSKILKGDRSLTIEHVKKLAFRFKINPAVFIE